MRNANSGETERRAGLLEAELRYGRIDDILAQGLHAYLTRFLEWIYDLGDGVSKDFLAARATARADEQTQSTGALFLAARTS